jgi:hypothetical protein
MISFMVTIFNHNQSSYEKSNLKRTTQYIKHKTESFDDYYPYRLKTANLFIQIIG